MLIPSLLSLTFAYGGNVDSSDEESTQDTAQQAPAVTRAKPTRAAPMSTREGQWDEVISLLHQVHGTQPMRSPLCHAARGDAHWIEVLTQAGEWKAASRPQPTLAAAVATTPLITDLKGPQPHQFVSCDVVKPWVESARVSKESALLITADALMVSAQPAASER